MAEGSDTKERTGFFGWVRRVDDAVFAVEQLVVALALITITVVIFIDVIARRITAPDSKVGQLISRFGGIEDFAERQWIDDHVAPWVTLGVSFVLITFGAFTGRRFARQRKLAAGEKVEPPSTGQELGIGAGIAMLGIAGVWALSMAFVRVDSWMVYATVFGASALGYAASSIRTKREGWPLRLAAALVIGALAIWVSVTYVPIGFTWSKKVSLLLLLWVGLLSASICVHEGKHIRMEAAGKLIPEAAQRWVLGVGAMATACFCAVMTYLGFRYVFAPTASDDEFMTEMLTWGGVRYVYGFEGMVGRGGLIEGTDIPDWVGILAAPVGFGIATVRFIGAGVSSFLGGSYGAPAAEEGMEEARQLAAVVADAETGPAEPEPSSRPESKSKPESKSEPESKSKSKPESKSTPKSKSKPESKSKSKPKPEPKPETSSRSEDANGEDGSESDDEGEPDADDESDDEARS